MLSRYGCVLLLCFLHVVPIWSQMVYEVIAPKTVNIRNSPTVKSRIIGKLHNGDVVEVEKFVGSWAAFNYKDKLAYVSSRYLREKKVEQPEIVEDEHNPILVATDSNMTTNVHREDSSLFDDDGQNRTTKTGKSSFFSFKNWNFQFGAEALAGYSNFYWDEGSPKSSFGFGGGGFLDANSPSLYFGSLYVGYNRKGSGAYPLSYLSAKIYPLGLKYAVTPEIQLYAKLGMNISLGFSHITDKYGEESADFDFGIVGSIGARYKQFGFGISYEHGCTPVIDSDVDLYNRNIFLTFSYYYLTF